MWHFYLLWEINSYFSTEKATCFKKREVASNQLNSQPDIYQKPKDENWNNFAV